MGVGLYLEKMGIGMMDLGKKVCRKEMAHIGGLMGASMWVFGVTSQKIRMGLITFSPTVGSSGCGLGSSRGICSGLE